MRRSAAQERFDAAVADHGRAVEAYAARMLADTAAGEDIAQEVWVRLMRHPEVLVNGRGSVRGWLLTVARRLVIDRVRAGQCRPEVIGATAEIVTEDPTELIVVAAALQQALDTLLPEHRAVVEEFYLRDRRVAEIAVELSIPVGTVKSRVHYALRALRETMSAGGAAAVEEAAQ